MLEFIIASALILIYYYYEERKEEKFKEDIACVGLHSFNKED